MTYGTRRCLTLGLTVAAAFAILSSSAIAQAGGRPAQRVSRDASDDFDALRPYGSNHALKDGRFEPTSSTRSRPTTTYREPVERPSAPPRTAASYYAGMRTGQGPNRNTYQPRSQTSMIPMPRCHPGRGALMGR